MKYPYVILVRDPQFQYIDQLFDTYSHLLECNIHILSNIDELKYLHNQTYHIIVSYSPPKTDNTLLFKTISTQIPIRMANQWIHIDFPISPENIPKLNSQINSCFAHHLINPSRPATRPIFSIFTTTYNTYEKINRAYNSVKSQTLRDWEWVIIDDSPDDAHFHYLRDTIFRDDPQVRLYRRAKNSGSIGNVKNEAVALCRGKYCVELDHDDELMPSILQEAAQVMDNNDTIGFVYSDFINVYESSTNGPSDNFKYSDFISFGYGGYYTQYFPEHKQWRYVYITPNINNITASALVALPNHPRIWRTDTLHKLGNYSEYLPICDDLEILLRTFADKNIGVVKLHKVGYIQYMNVGGNNFSLLRNSEINRLGPQYISPVFFDRYNMHQKFRDRNAYEDESYLVNHSQLWMRPADPIYTHKYINEIRHPDFDTQCCIIGVHTFRERLRDIQIAVMEDPRVDFILLENSKDVSIQILWDMVENANLQTRVKVYVLPDTSYENLILFFHRLYRSCDTYKLLYVPPTITESISTNPPRNIGVNLATRYDIINSMCQPSYKTYLEIGIEYGHTFERVNIVNKIGVDPSPKMVEPNKETGMKLYRMLSDDYFQELDTQDENTAEMFDVIFIDGMHHSDAVWKDLSNSLRYLTQNGMIFIDDILPMSEMEQYRVPKKHYFEDGVLKYKDGAWTGDVWKTIYYLLTHMSDKFKYKVFEHPNYRGVLCLFDIDSNWKMERNIMPTEIEQYTYLADFTNYVSILHTIQVAKI